MNGYIKMDKTTTVMSVCVRYQPAAAAVATAAAIAAVIFYVCIVSRSIRLLASHY